MPLSLLPWQCLHMHGFGVNRQASAGFFQCCLQAAMPQCVALPTGNDLGAAASHDACQGTAEACVPACCRGDDLDTRLLRAMVIKGILEQITNSLVNLVNADLLAKTRGLRIIESNVPSEGR